VDFGGEHAACLADVICCRHTLEHIFNPRAFMETVRRSVAHDDVLLLFEVSDTGRVLRDLAFWEIDYERCAYFTETSLEELFRASGFAVVELERVDQTQSLILAARPATQRGRRRAPLPVGTEAVVAETLGDVRRFEREHEDHMRHWRTLLDEFAARGQRVVAWGAEAKCVAWCGALELGAQLAYAVGLNPHQQGKFLPGTGHRVVGPSHVASEPPDLVVVMNSIDAGKVEAELRMQDMECQVIPLTAPVAHLLVNS
jgi:hypothetical protein